MDHFHQMDAEGDIQMMDATPLRPILQPRRRLGAIGLRLATAYQNVQLIINNTATRVVTGYIQRGVKRSAEKLLDTRDRTFTALIELRQSSDDGLQIKRFKSLPTNPDTSSNPHAQRRDPLPVDYLKSIKDEFRWTDDCYAYLGKHNHAALEHWIEAFMLGMKGGYFTQFNGISDVVDPLRVPQEIKDAIQALGKNEALSIVMHNYMIREELKGSLTEDYDPVEKHTEASEMFWSRLQLFQTVYKEVYEKEGRIAIMKANNLKPYGPCQYPYAKYGHDTLYARNKLIRCIDLLRFLLSQRDAFNQMFPVETVAGVLADIDAIHKDEPAPSHVDWPGKDHRNCPGSYPNDLLERLLFETVPERDFEPVRMWDHQHLSPAKPIATKDYDTPHRKAMQKNELYYDANGQAWAKKGHLKPECAPPAAKKKNARFMEKQLAWYKPSTNVPVQRRELAAPSPLSVTIKQAAQAVEAIWALPKFTDAVGKFVPTVVEPTQAVLEPAQIVVENVETAQTGEPTQDLEVAPFVERVEYIEPIGPAQAVENAQVVEPAPVVKLPQAVEHLQAVKSIPTVELVQAIEPTHPIEPSQPAEPTSDIEPAEQKGANGTTNDHEYSMEQTAKYTELAKSVAQRPIFGRATSLQYKNIDDFFDQDDQGPFGKGLSLKLSAEKAFDLEIRQQLEADGILRVQNEAIRIAAEKQRLAEEARLQAEQKRLQAQEELRLAEQRRQEEEDRELAETGTLRAPHRPIIPNMSIDWTDKAMHTLQARSNAELAKSPDGTVLQRKDFETVVQQNQWLNDEIVNATLLHLGNYVNQKAGIKNTRVRTPKIQIFNSFVGKNLNDGRPPTERMLRRAGIRRDNFLDIETILIPLCRSYHWTILVIRPKHRQIYHLDSLSGRSDPRLVGKAEDWVKGVLGDDYKEDEWTLETLSSPLQSNTDDCGVHTITNGICLGMGVDVSAYDASDMSRQRLHLAAVLLNGGFHQDFTLDGI